MNKVEWRSIFFLFVFLPLSLQLSRATINRLRELRLVAPIHSNSNQNSKKVKSTTSFFFDDSLFMFYFLYLFSCSSFLGWFFLSLEVEFLLSSGRVATLLSPSAVIVRTFFLVCDSFQAIRRITATWLCFLCGFFLLQTRWVQWLFASLSSSLLSVETSFDSCSLRVLSSRVRSVPWGNANWIEIRLSKPFLVRSSYLYIFLWLVMRAGPFLFTKWSPCLILWDFVD